MKSLMDHTKKGRSVMTKEDLVEKMAEDAGLSKAAAGKALKDSIDFQASFI